MRRRRPSAQRRTGARHPAVLLVASRTERQRLAWEAYHEDLVSLPTLQFVFGVSRATIYRWADLGKSNPRLSRAELIEAALAWRARNGRLPTSALWNRALARQMGDDGIPAFELWRPVAEGGAWRRYPHYRQAEERFGGWPAFRRAVAAEIRRRREENDPYVAIEPPGNSRLAAALAQRAEPSRTPTRVVGGPMDRLYLEAVAEAVRDAATASPSPTSRHRRGRRARNLPMVTPELRRWLQRISRE